MGKPFKVNTASYDRGNECDLSEACIYYLETKLDTIIFFSECSMAEACGGHVYQLA